MKEEIQFDEQMPHQKRLAEHQRQQKREWKPPVSKPKFDMDKAAMHYGSGKQLQAAEAMLEYELHGIRAGYKFQALDYLWRMGHKGSVEDALKDAKKLEFWAKKLREYQEHLLDVEAKRQDA